jgi:hypothetical protein
MSPIQQMLLGSGGAGEPSGESSVLFDANDERITWGASDDFVQSGDCTVEAWFKKTNSGTSSVYAFWEWGDHTTGGNNGGGTLIYLYNSKFWIYENNINTYDQSSAYFPQNQWVHIACVRYQDAGNTNVYVFKDGTLLAGGYISTRPWGGTASGKTFSQGTAYNSRFQGYVSNLRLTNQALYTSSFTPSTSPLTLTSQGATASNVKLLTFNDPSSLTGATVQPNTPTVTGSPTVSTDHPF